MCAREKPVCPDEQACLALLQTYGTPAHVIAHCKAVAAAADRMGHALVERGYALNLRLIRAAALLHDIARTEPDHPTAGARYVERAGGCPALGEIIRVHMDLPEEMTDRITEAMVVYLADKLVEEDREVTLEQRFLPRIHRAEEPVRTIIEEKYRRAQRVFRLVEAALSGENRQE